MHFCKYHALGNDYVVLDAESRERLTPVLVRRICDRHYGLGADGVLVGEADASAGAFSLWIWNPDGSPAEKSGNGIRIYARYLWDHGLVSDEGFTITTPGGPVRCQVGDGGRQVYVEMGRASFDSESIPLLGPRREVVNEPLAVGGRVLHITALTVGNPHCVVHVDRPTPALARRLGPLIEHHSLFPRRTNVQFAQALGPDRIRIEIWERGAGYTLASGSSACAAAAASVRLGLCQGDVTVAMPGGTLAIGVGVDWFLTMVGPASRVAEGEIAGELITDAKVWRDAGVRR
jgi:diaminopimelate epimerase